MKLEINCIDIAKTFSSTNYIFENVNLKIKTGDCLAVTGHNGSGKSTLLKIISGILNQTKGKVEYSGNGQNIYKDNFKSYYGFVAPYLNLYEEFHPVEHLKIFSKIRDIPFEQEYYKELLHRFKLFDSRRKLIGEYSSGMKQRMKFVLALQHKPQILFLDEPTSNLDEEGISTVNSIINEFIVEKKIIIMATNEEREKSLCNKYFSLEN